MKTTRRLSSLLSSLWLVACSGDPHGVAPPPAPSLAQSTTPVAAPTASPSIFGAPSSSASSIASVVAPPPPALLTFKSYDLPAGKGDASLDFLLYEPKKNRVWIPMARGDVGSVDVFDIATTTFTRVGGFKIKEKEANGKKRTMGPSSASVGDGVVYVGDRATNEVCVVGSATSKLGKCVGLPVAPDGVVYLASSKEVWVTSPHAKTIVVLDATKPDAPKQKKVLTFEGAPEGYAVDESRGLFYTNFEDKDRTVAIDAKTYAVKSNWSAGCGEDGPRGLVVDVERNFIVVACTDHVQVIDAGKDGALLGKMDTGAGVDLLDFLPSKKLVYVAAGKAAKLTVGRLDDQGKLDVVGAGATTERARNAVVDADGNAYLVDPAAPRLLVFSAPK